MRNNSIKLFVLVLLFQTTYNTANSQEKLLLSYQHNYLLARASDPVDTKYSPQWKKMENQDIAILIPTVPIGFPFLGKDMESNTKSYLNILTSFIKGFVFEPHNYGDYAETDQIIFPYIISYGILGNGNYTKWFYKEYPKVVDTLFCYFANSENASILLSYYIKPIVSWSLSCMSETTRSSYKTILAETKKYIKTLYDDKIYNKELEYCKGRKDFSYKDPKGVVDPFRKTKIFVFRRYTDFKAKTWKQPQLEEFEKVYGYRPKPKWGMSLSTIEKNCKIVEAWF